MTDADADSTQLEVSVLLSRMPGRSEADMRILQQTGLSVHLNQVHKETLEHVENALPNRQGLEVEIFGMEGIPAETLDQHRNRIIQNFYQAQEDRRLATGNPLPGHAMKNSRPKIKYETAEELLARFAEFQTRRKAGALNPNAMEGVETTDQDSGAYVCLSRPQVKCHGLTVIESNPTAARTKLRPELPPIRLFRPTSLWIYSGRFTGTTDQWCEWWWSPAAA